MEKNREEERQIMLHAVSFTETDRRQTAESGWGKKLSRQKKKKTKTKGKKREKKKKKENFKENKGN